MAKHQFESEGMTSEELDRRIAAIRAAKRRRIEGGDPRGLLKFDEIEKAIEDAERREGPEVTTATSNGKASPPRCESCGRAKTPRARGYRCKPCWDASRSGVEPTPVVNPRPPKPTYDEPTALERQMGPEPKPAEESIERLVERMPAEVVRAPADWGVEEGVAVVEPDRPNVDDDDLEELKRELWAMRTAAGLLGGLRPSTRRRVVTWLADRFDGGGAA